MILEDNASKTSNESLRVAVNIFQVIRFNSVKQQRRGSAENTRHFITNEPLLPVAVALMIYSNTRKRALVNEIASEELCVWYQRVKDIERGISNQLCSKYNNDGIVCPPKLHPGMLVTSTIDNIDHNLWSNTATSSFHGTLISIFQYPDGPIQHPPFAFVSGSISTRRNKLASSYTDIKPTKGGKPEPLEFKSSSYEFSSQDDVTSEVSDWIQKL